MVPFTYLPGTVEHQQDKDESEDSKESDSDVKIKNFQLLKINLPIGIFAGLLDLDLAFFLLGLADEDPSPEPRVPPSMTTLMESLQHNEEQLTQGLNHEIFWSTQSLCGERNLSLPD